MANAPGPNASSDELVSFAVEQGFTAEEAQAYSREELIELFASGDPEDAYQDQGSLDQPTQSTPASVPTDVGTEELRDEAHRRVTGVNRKREPFPWEVGPPRR